MGEGLVVGRQTHAAQQVLEAGVVAGGVNQANQDQCEIEQGIILVILQSLIEPFQGLIHVAQTTIGKTNQGRSRIDSLQPSTKLQCFSLSFLLTIIKSQKSPCKRAT